MTYTMTLLDTSGIQNYLFASNRMTHNIGASYLVEQAMNEWVKEALNDRSEGEIENGSAAVERIYSGGGNAMLLFTSHDLAGEFTQRYTRLLLQRAPGLRVVVQHTKFEWTDALANVYDHAIKELAQKKAQQAPLMPMLGLGVTAACTYSGLPAIERGEDDRFVSAELWAKSKIGESNGKARQRIRSDFAHEIGDYDFAYDFNLLGEQRSAYMAIVHADGNGIGKRKQEICRQFPNSSQNRAFINGLRDFSTQVSEAGKSAFRDTLTWLKDWLQENDKPDDKGRYRFLRKGEKDEPESLRVPFVPLIYGGDDVTFVCDGRLGLSLATKYLNLFSKKQIDGKPLYACVGVAVVKSRFPFARAYQMAEELSRNAKREVHSLQERQIVEDAAALDWHFAVNGAVRSIREIRQREYTTPQGSLVTRPLFLNAGHASWKEWDTFRNLVNRFTSSEDWKGSRNKVKKLRETLRNGKEDTRLFLQALDKTPPAKLPGIDELDDGRDDGWRGNTCIYFDAIEAMDLFVDMEK